MTPEKRRDYILSELVINKEPIKGQEFSEKLEVTRQVIVKDIAILKAEGHEIISTPKGYMISTDNKGLKKVIAVCHDPEDIEKELKIIVKYGGIIEDIKVEHPIYGEITSVLLLKTIHDIEIFSQRLKNTAPLSVLTGGVHLHTIRYGNEEMLKNILKELKSEGILLSDEGDESNGKE